MFDISKATSLTAANPLSDVMSIYRQLFSSGLSSSAADINSELGGPEPAGSRNLALLADTTLSLLRKENREEEYLELLKANLKGTDWAHAMRMSFTFRFEAEYHTLCSVVIGGPPGGMWPIITYDLLEPLDQPLLHRQIPNLIDRHPGFITEQDLPTWGLARLRATFTAAATELQARISPGTVRKVVEFIMSAVERFNHIAEFVEHLQQMQEARDRAKREEAERDAAKAKERIERGERGESIRGAEDYVDRFEKNHDLISRTC